MISFLVAFAALVNCDTGVNGEFFGSRAIQEFDELVGIPIQRTTLTARTEINAAFNNRNDHFNPANGLVQANMKLKTFRPTLNLINFVQIKDIKCQDGQTELVFDQESSATQAFNEWSQTKDLTMMIGQSFHCDGSNVAFVGVLDMERVHNILKFKNQIFEAKDIIEEYQLDISKFEASEQLFDWDVERELAVFPLNLNYDPSTKTVTRPEISLWENQFAKFDCVDCHTRGDAKLRVLLTGSALKVNTYKLELDGGVTANINLKAGIKTAGDRELIMVTLYTLALNPVQVPGIFKFGPELRIKAGASYGSSSELAVTTGFEVAFPFNFKVFSDKGITARPQFAFNGTPKPTAHPLTLSKGEVHVNAHVIPEIFIGVEIVTAKLELLVAMDNVLGTEASTKQGCAAAPVQVLLYHKHTVGVDATVMNEKYNWSLWDTGRRPLKCFYCNQCPAQ